jgi:beta-carotene 3-hydroxylase
MNPVLNAVAITVVTMAVMEPVAAAVHRFVGHGPGWVLHRDHHDPGPGRLERNDAIPAAFALVAMGAFWTGLGAPERRWLFWVALGVTLYGLTYAMVHDVYIHRRLPLLPRRVTWLEPMRRAHVEHHRHGGAPYGVLLPLGPRWRSPAARPGAFGRR